MQLYKYIFVFDVAHAGPMFDARVEQDEPRSDCLLHRAAVHPTAGSVSLGLPVLPTVAFKLRHFHATLVFLLGRFEPGPGRADGGGPPAAGVSAGGAAPPPGFAVQSQRRAAHGRMRVAASGGGVRLRRAVQLSGKQSEPGANSNNSSEGHQYQTHTIVVFFFFL